MRAYDVPDIVQVAGICEYKKYKVLPLMELTFYWTKKQYSNKYITLQIVISAWSKVEQYKAIENGNKVGWLHGLKKLGTLSTNDW